MEITAFARTSLMITAAMCLLAVFVAWYTVRDRVKLSQIILGLFCYVLVMLLQNVLETLGYSMGLDGPVYGVFTVVSVVFSRELIRFAAMQFGVRRNFQGADASIGFALGFAGAYLLICGVYYFNCFAAARELFNAGAEGFLSGAGADTAEAEQFLETITSQSGWEFLLTGLNRVFYLVREIALCLLLWYAMDRDSDRLWYVLVPLLHLLAVLPDGLYQGGILQSAPLRDGVTIVLSAGIAVLAARWYNTREDQVTHYSLEKLQTRRRR